MTKPRKKKPNQEQREIRLSVKPQKFEIRQNADGTRSVAGYFATFGTMSHDLGFREVLQDGCFSESLKDNPVACFRDHDAQMLLGKTQSGTLEVSEDQKGLAFRVKLPDTSYANDLVSLMERGDSYECSFAFAPLPDGEIWSQLPSGEVLRTITNAVLFEGSILTGPAAAYPNTSASLRACPANLKVRLRRKRDDDDDLDDDVCNPDSDSYDPDACQALKDDDDEDDEDREICSECGQPIPREEDDDDEERQAHMQLLIRRLRS